MKLTPFQFNLLVFTIGLGATAQANLGFAHFSFSELILIGLVPFAIFSKRSLSGSALVIPLVLLGFWILSACISDFFINGTYRAQAYKGIFRTIIFGMCLISLHSLFRLNPLAWRYYVIGAFFSAILGFTIFKAGSISVMKEFGEVRGTDWAQTYNYIFSGALGILNAWFFIKFPRFICSLIISLGGLNILLGSRSSGAIQILVGLVTLYFVIFYLSRRRRKKFQLKSSQILVAGTLCLLAAISVYLSYSFLAGGGYIGEDAKSKYLKQSRSSMGLVFGGRRETYAGLLAVKDKPIFGHGSFALDIQGYWAGAIEDLGGGSDTGRRAGYLYHIPHHSRIVQAWVEHGVAGAIFWVYLLYFYAQFIRRSILSCPPLLGVLIGIVFAAYWHYIFSPIGFRVTMASSIALVFAVYDRQVKAAGNRRRPRG